MALLANGLRRSRIGRGHIDRPLEIVRHGVIKLLHAVELGLEISGRARTDMACDAFDFGMGRVLRSDELRLHWQMAGLAAELHRLGVLVGLITAEGSDEQEADTARGKNGQEFSGRAAATRSILSTSGGRGAHCAALCFALAEERR